MAISAAPHFLSTRDSSLMWASSGICMDGACTQEHVPVTTLDGARFHLPKSSNALIATVIAVAFPPPEQPASSATETASQPKVIKERVVMRFDAFSKKEPVVAALSFSTTYSSLLSERIGECTLFPTGVPAIVAHFVGPHREAIDLLASDFFTRLNHGVGRVIPSSFGDRLNQATKQFAKATAAAPASTEASATAAAGTAAKTTTEKS